MTVMTEAEAKTKWCPFYQRSTGSQAFETTNRMGESRCVASDCMGWRVMPAPSVPKKPYIERIRDHRATHGSSLVIAKAAVDAEMAAESIGVGRGYCGLAGSVRP